MSKPFSLQTILELAGREHDAAARHLGAANARLVDQESKLATLVQYRLEYQVRFRDAVARGLEAEGWRNFHEFMDRLETAIREQQVAVESHRAVVTGAQADLMDKRRRLAGFDALRARHASAERKVEQRREQSDLDEQALKMSARKAARLSF